MKNTVSKSILYTAELERSVEAIASYFLLCGLRFSAKFSMKRFKNDHIILHCNKNNLRSGLAFF